MPDADSVDSRDEPAADELGPADRGGASLTREGARSRDSSTTRPRSRCCKSARSR